MSLLSRDQQIQVIGCLTEGMSIRAIERLTGIHRDTIMRLGARVGRGCAELHDRIMVGLRVGRMELDELWAFVGKKQRHLKRTDSPEKGDQYTFIALASSSRAIIGYRTGKRRGRHDGPVRSGLARARDWFAGNFDGWLSAVSTGDPRRIPEQRPRRYQQDLQRHASDA